MKKFWVVLALGLGACGVVDVGSIGGSAAGQGQGAEHLYAMRAGPDGSDVDLGPWLGGTVALSPAGALEFSIGGVGTRLYYPSPDCSGQGYFVRPQEVLDTATTPPTQYGGGAIGSRLGVAGGVIYRGGTVLGRNSGVTAAFLPRSAEEHAGGDQWSCAPLELPISLRAAGAGATPTGRLSERYGNLVVRRIVP